MRPVLTACLLAGLAPALVLAESRREPLRVPSSRHAAVSSSPDAALLAAARKLDAIRLEQEYGTDWDEALVETVTGDVTVLLARHGGSWKGRGLGRDAIRAPDVSRRVQWYLDVRRDPSVRSIEPNPRTVHPACRQMSLDILQSGQRAPDLSAQVALQISAAASGVVADGVIVAIVDSGVAPLPELQGQLLPTIDMLARRGPRVVTDPADLLEHAGDANGHGTAMASLVASLARGARILPVRVVGADCAGTAFDLASGLLAARDAGARVALVSLSMSVDSPVLRRAVAEVTASGMLVVAAAGNTGAIEYPARLPGVLAVTAIHDDLTFPAFAPLGTRLDVAAPGVNVLTRGPEGDLRLTGTSPAAAVSAAAVARIVYVLGDFGPPEWVSALRWATRPVTPIAPGFDDRLGGGLLDFTPLR